MSSYRSIARPVCGLDNDNPVGISECSSTRKRVISAPMELGNMTQEEGLCMMLFFPWEPEFSCRIGLLSGLVTSEATGFPVPGGFCR